MEEQSVIDILVDGIGNATEGVWNATKDKVNEIIAEGGECLGDPKTCAKEVFDKIKDIFGEGAVDPTSTGGNIPDWMKVIIIGGAYGDEILGELEDLFGGDIDGDDLVGPPEDPTVTPPVTAEFDCAGVFKNGGKVTDESQCGGCLEGYDPDGQGGCTVAPIDCARRYGTRLQENVKTLIRDLLKETPAKQRAVTAEHTMQTEPVLQTL